MSAHSAGTAEDSASDPTSLLENYEPTHDRYLLDRLATLGLGGPLFTSTPSEDFSASEEDSEAEEDEVSRLMRQRRRPSKLAEALTRKAYRDHHRVQRGPSVKWVSQVEAVTAALDAVEGLGKG